MGAGELGGLSTKREAKSVRATMHISPLLVLVTIELEQKERRTCSHSHFRRSVVLSEHVFPERLINRTSL